MERREALQAMRLKTSFKISTKPGFGVYQSWPTKTHMRNSAFRESNPHQANTLDPSLAGESNRMPTLPMQAFAPCHPAPSCPSRRKPKIQKTHNCASRKTRSRRAGQQQVVLVELSTEHRGDEASTATCKTVRISGGRRNDHQRSSFGCSFQPAPLI